MTEKRTDVELFKVRKLLPLPGKPEMQIKRWRILIKFSKCVMKNKKGFANWHFTVVISVHFYNFL